MVVLVIVLQEFVGMMDAVEVVELVKVDKLVLMEYAQFALLIV